MVRPASVIKTNKEDSLLVEQFLEMMASERVVSGSTLSAYKRDLLGFLGYCLERKQRLKRVSRNKIEDYLDNLMNEAERAEFELAMQNDKALTKQVAIVQEINHTIGLESKFHDFQQTLNQLNQQHFQTTTIEKVSKTVTSEVQVLTTPF